MYLLQEGLHTESFLDPCWLSPIALVDGSLPAPCRGQSLICWLPEEEAPTVPLTSPPPTASGREGQQGVVREGPVLAPCSLLLAPGSTDLLVKSQSYFFIERDVLSCPGPSANAGS